MSPPGLWAWSSRGEGADLEPQGPRLPPLSSSGRSHSRAVGIIRDQDSTAGRDAEEQRRACLETSDLLQP